jgi:cleavage and polyadenylation specificity factor subunit 5
MAGLPSVINLYPAEAYSFGGKPALRSDDRGGSAERLARRERRYAAEGARRGALAVLLVHQHGHPHVLLLRSEASGLFSLPGGSLKPGESDLDGLQRKLRAKLCPSASSLGVRFWEVGELVACWHRPHFDADVYPYPLPHVSRSVETQRVYLVRLPEKCFFAVPAGLKLVAVPLFELHGNTARYGAHLATLPAALSRFHCNVLDKEG